MWEMVKRWRECGELWTLTERKAADTKLDGNKFLRKEAKTKTNNRLDQQEQTRRQVISKPVVAHYKAEFS